MGRKRAVGGGPGFEGQGETAGAPAAAPVLEQPTVSGAQSHAQSVALFALMNRGGGALPASSSGIPRVIKFGGRGILPSGPAGGARPLSPGPVDTSAKASGGIPEKLVGLSAALAGLRPQVPSVTAPLSQAGAALPTSAPTSDIAASAIARARAAAASAIGGSAPAGMSNLNLQPGQKLSELLNIPGMPAMKPRPPGLGLSPEFSAQLQRLQGLQAGSQETAAEPSAGGLDSTFAAQLQRLQGLEAGLQETAAEPSAGGLDPTYAAQLQRLQGLEASLATAAEPSAGFARQPVAGYEPPPGALDSSLAARSFQQIAAEYDQLKNFDVNPQVQEFADHHKLDEPTTRAIDQELKKRRNTMEADLQSLWLVTDGAKNPMGVIMQKLREMRLGTFQGMSAIDKKLTDYAKRNDLDAQATVKLAELMQFREDPEGDLLKLEKLFERSNRPSALLMMMLKDLKDGKIIKEPDRSAAIGSKLHQQELKEAADKRARSRSRKRGMHDESRGGRNDRRNDRGGDRRDDRGGDVRDDRHRSDRGDRDRGGRSDRSDRGDRGGRDRQDDYRGEAGYRDRGRDRDRDGDYRGGSR